MSDKMLEAFEADRPIPSHMKYNKVMNHYYAHDHIQRKAEQDNLNKEWKAFQDGWKAAQRWGDYWEGWEEGFKSAQSEAFSAQRPEPQ